MIIASIVTYLVLLVVLAKLVSEKMAGLGDFFLAGQKLSGLFIAMTFAAAWFGAGSTIGTMNAAFSQGLSALWLIAIPTLGSFLIIGLVLARPIRRMNIMTIPEAIERHYGPIGSFLLALVILCSTTTFIASQLVAAGSLMQLTTGLVPWQSITLVYAVIVLYSIIGGFRAVVLTDALQVLFFTTGVGLLFYFATTHTLQTPGALAAIPPGYWRLDHNLMANCCMTLTFIMAWCIAPEMWQRMAAVRNESEASQSILIAGMIVMFLYGMVALTGVQAYGMLSHHDPFVQKNVLLSLAMQMPSTWLVGLVLVGVMSAISSTIDSSLNVACLTMVRNLIQRYFWPTADGNQLVMLSRLSTVVLGVPGILIALYYQDIIRILWKSADIYASTMFLPIMGLFFLPRAGKRAGVLAMTLGLIPVMLGFVSDFVPGVMPQWWPQWPYTTLLGVAMSLMGFVLGMLWKRWMPMADQNPETVGKREKLGV